MVFDVTPIFAAHLAGNRGPDPGDPGLRRAPNYGVVATLNGDVLQVELTFRSGSAYCCSDWGCHVALTPLAKRWDALRSRLVDQRILPPERIELRLTCVIEEGALFFDFRRPDPQRRGWYAFETVAAWRYPKTVIEVPSKAGDTALPHTQT